MLATVTPGAFELLDRNADYEGRRHQANSNPLQPLFDARSSEGSSRLRPRQHGGELRTLWNCQS
jgi:hypothetical protein